MVKTAIGRQTFEVISARLTRPSWVFSAVLLVWLLVWFVISLQPGFRGGSFVALVLGTTTALLLGSLLWEQFNPRSLPVEDANPRPAQDYSLETRKSGKADLTWPQVVVVSEILCGLLLAVFLLGMVMGSAMFLFAVWHFRGGMKWWLALISTLVVGVLLPVIFAKILALRLWLGIIPAIFPGVGGGILPPL